MFRRRVRRLVPLLSCGAAVALLAASTPQAAQAPLPSAREIVDRSITATGGAAALKAVRSLHLKGTISIRGQNMTGELDVKAARPNKVVSHGSISGIGEFDEGFDGKVGWMIDPQNGPALVTGKALIQRTADAWFDAPLHAADYVKEMTVVGKETFDQRPAYKVKVVLVAGMEKTEYFDVETGFMIGAEATHEMPMGSMPTREIFRDFKTYGALTMPAQQVESMLGLEQIVTITSYEFNTVPATAFALPPRIKALIK